MQHTQIDTAFSLTFALLMHVALFAALYLGFRAVPAPTISSVAGPAIEAELVLSAPDIRRVEQLLKQTSTPKPTPVQNQQSAPPVQTIPEPSPQNAKLPPQLTPQQQLPQPDTREQERAALLAEQQKQQLKHEQEQRRRQEQADLTERIKTEEVERKQRLAKLQRERLAQIAELQRQRLALNQDSSQTSVTPANTATASSITPQPNTTDSGNNGVQNELLGKYKLAIEQIVERNWIRPDTVPIGSICTVKIIQIPGGEVIDAKVVQPCAYDGIGQRSLEAAVLRAQPLPYSGFESVFARQLELQFRAED